MADFEHFNTVPPHEREQQQSGEKPVETPETVNQSAPETPPAVTPPAEPDTFIENLNKRYGTAYKSDEEIKSIFGLPQKVTELEERYKDYDAHKSSAESYKNELEELKNAGYGDFFNKPLIRSAYIAEKLQEKYPKADGKVLAEIAMSDLEQMDDLDAVAKEQKIRLPKLELKDIKAALLSELGIDPDTKPEEWDSVSRTKLAIKAATARQNISDLMKGIELPKFPSKEEKEAAMAVALQKKAQLAEPVKAKFTAFDEYVNGDFKFGVPPEFKEKLGEMFQGMFIDSGLEINEANLATAEVIKRGLFLDEYLPKILEAKATQVRTELQQKVDKELNNDTLPNTATATDEHQQDSDLPGVSKFFKDQQTQRATKL